MSKGPIPIIAAAAALTGLMLALYLVGGSGGSSTGSDPRSEKKDYGKVSKTKKKSKNDGAGKSNSANRTNDHHPDHDHGVKRSRSMDSTLSDQEFDTEESSTIVSNLTMTSVEGGGEGDACKTSRVPADPETPSQATAVATKEKKSRIKKQRLKKIHGMLKTTMDYLEQTADADEVITVASSPSFGRKSSAGGRTAVMVSEELAAEGAVDASSSSHVQNVGDDAEVGGGETKVEVEDDQVGTKPMAESEPQLMPKQEAKLGRSIERSTTGEDAISEGEIDVLDATPEAVAAADEGEVKLHTEIIAEKAHAPGLDENNAANEAGLMEQTGDLLDSGAKDAATEQFHVRKSHAKASSEAAPQTKPIAESSGESANASNSTLPVSTYPSEIENANVTEELVAEEAASDVEYVGEVIDPSNPEDGTAELPPENKEPEQLLKETEPKNQQEGQGSPTPLQREETQPKLTQSEPQQQAFPSPETTVATQHQPSASVTTSPSKPIPVKEKEKIVDDEPMEPPTDTTDYSLLKTYWKKQSDKNKFKAPIEDVAAVKSVIAATTLSSPAEKPQQLLKRETQQQKQQQVVVEDSQLILNKGSGSDSSSNSKDGSEEEGYVKVLHSPSGIPMTESELLTSPVVGKEVEVKTEKTKETIEEMTTAKIDEGTEESQGTILEKEEDKAEKSVTKTADEDSPNSFKEGSEPIDITSAEPIKAVEGAKEGAEETDAIPKVDEGKTDNPKIATSNKKKKKKKGKKK